MRNKLISEKSFCYCSRYVHKRKIANNGIFEFNFINEQCDSNISYDGRWSKKQSLVLDVLSDLIYLQTYDKLYNMFPRNFNDERVLDNCSELTDDIINNVVNNELPYIYQLKLNKEDLVEKYPYIFRNFTNRDFVDFFKSAMINMKLNYRVKLNDKWFVYEMKKFDKLFDLTEIPLKIKSDGKIWDSEIEINFNTPLGFFFQHNIKSLNFHIIDPKIYACKNSACIFVYKRFILSKNKMERRLKKTDISFKTLCEFLSYNSDSNMRVFKRKIDEILKELDQFIDYEECKNFKNSTESSIYRVFFV